MTNITQQQAATALPINFTINVAANEEDPNTEEFKVKVVIDFAPPFSGGNGSVPSSFNANKIHRILTFISDRVLKKVVEAVYYDRDNATYDDKSKKYKPVKDFVLPDNFEKAMAIYDERQAKKSKGEKDYLDYLELEKDGNENCIECIVNKFFTTEKRPIWSKENNVTRITFEQMSPPSLTVETRTVVNGDKKPK